MLLTRFPSERIAPSGVSNMVAPPAGCARPASSYNSKSGRFDRRQADENSSEVNGMKGLQEVRRSLGLLLSVLLWLGAAAAVMGQQQEKDGEREKRDQQSLAEEQENYFKRWLKEDVVYIISPQERAVFEKLNTPEEREQFIEQFWYRRDPDPRTSTNEFKDEHYRRIAYANERFSSGLPGWVTDRGRVYIIHGPPAEIESHPTGGNYNRPFHEGGGSTSTYPFEIWRYRYIEGMGNDIVIEFVDPTLSGEYRLALNPEEKDALLFVPGAGLTLAESLGLAQKKDRPFFSPGNTEYPFMNTRYKDSAFARYETYTQIQRATPIKYTDLKQLVEINITYDELPFQVRDDYFRLNPQRVLVPLTVDIDNKNLSFEEEGGRLTAKVAVYGIVTSITNRIVTEFEDDLQATVTPAMLQAGAVGRSVYQKNLLLENRGRYKIDLVVKDLRSGHVGVLRKALVPPASQEENLSPSSLVLSNFVRVLEDVPKEDRMFVLGDVWIRPSVDKIFSPADPLNVYLQLYNMGIDQTSLAPSLVVTYRILDKNGELLLQLEDDQGASVQFVSGQRVVLIRQFQLDNFEPGPYVVEVGIRDRIKDQSIQVSERFRVKPPKQVASMQ